MIRKIRFPGFQALEPFWFALLAIFIGIVAGLGAIAFRALISFVHNLSFNGTVSMVFDTTRHAAESRWGAGIILVPVLGSFLVVYLTENFAPEAKGHGVPEVMDAIYYKRGVIRPFVALIKSLVSAISIGTGGAVGREGPIIQIGSSLGSTLGQWIPMSAAQRVTLIASGAGAGIAATFNTPLGGVLFAVELMLHEVSVKTLVPVALSTVAATFVGRMAFGNHPAFTIPPLPISNAPAMSLASLPLYGVLGVLLGLASLVFIQFIYKGEDAFEKWIPKRPYLRHATGMLAVGLLMYIFFRFAGHYYVQGVGYATIQDILSNPPLPLAFLGLLFFGKLLATTITLGSGASGGIFSPGLFLGAILGAAFGRFADSLFPGAGLDSMTLAVAGMAGMIGGTTGAAMTAILMTFEMTLDYNIILPITITVALSYGIRKMLCADSIYTLKLTRRGHHVPEALHTNFSFLIPAGKIMTPPPPTLRADISVEEFAKVVATQPKIPFYILREKGTYFAISETEAIAALSGKPDESLLKTANRSSVLWMETSDRLVDVIAGLKKTKADLVLVRKAGQEEIAGLITRLRIEMALEDIAEVLN